MFTLYTHFNTLNNHAQKSHQLYILVSLYELYNMKITFNSYNSVHFNL